MKSRPEWYSDGKMHERRRQSLPIIRHILSILAAFVIVITAFYFGQIIGEALRYWYNEITFWLWKEGYIVLRFLI